jgi:hypothetical protein
MAKPKTKSSLFEPPRCEKELLDLLRRHRSEVEAWMRRPLTKEEIASTFVGSNTFRVLRHGEKDQIKTGLKCWAKKMLNDQRFKDKVLSLNTQKAYDEWLKNELCTSLCVHCKKHGISYGNEGIPLDERYGPKTKIANLFMKSVARWDELTDNERTRLIGLLHLPLDRNTLNALRECARNTKDHIPSNAAMGFVKEEDQYEALQELARSIIKPKASPIYIDILFWDVPRLYGLAKEIINEVGVSAAKGIIEQASTVNAVTAARGVRSGKAHVRG